MSDKDLQPLLRMMSKTHIFHNPMVPRTFLATFSGIRRRLLKGKAICGKVSTLECFSGPFLPAIQQDSVFPRELCIDPKLLWIGCSNPSEQFPQPIPIGHKIDPGPIEICIVHVNSADERQENSIG